MFSVDVPLLFVLQTFQSLNCIPYKCEETCCLIATQTFDLFRRSGCLCQIDWEICRWYSACKSRQLSVLSYGENVPEKSICRVHVLRSRKIAVETLGFVTWNVSLFVGVEAKYAGLLAQIIVSSRLNVCIKKNMKFFGFIFPMLNTTSVRKQIKDWVWGSFLKPLGAI